MVYSTCFCTSYFLGRCACTRSSSAVDLVCAAIGKPPAPKAYTEIMYVYALGGYCLSEAFCRFPDFCVFNKSDCYSLWVLVFQDPSLDACGTENLEKVQSSWMSESESSRTKTNACRRISMNSASLPRPTRTFIRSTMSSISCNMEN